MTTSVKDRLFIAGAQLFAGKGFDSVSVREICKAADTSMNMIHHYFGSKEGLYDAIVATFTEKVFAYPVRLLDKEVRSKEEFITRTELFVEETLNALIDQRLVLHIVMRHEIEPTAFVSLLQKFVAFLKAAQVKGYVRSSIDPEMISGFVMDRLGNQVLFAQQIKGGSGYDIIDDTDYRSRWVKANIDLFLFGLSA